MLAIIPARSGSKTLKNKNILKFAGKPLIHWTILAALKSKKIDKIIISTDSNKISKICKKISKKVLVPFLRPKYLAKDNSAAIDSYLFTLDKLEKKGKKIKDFIVLLPTSPLRNYKDIDNAINYFERKNAETVISCVKTKPFNWYLKREKNEKINEVFRNKALVNRQEYENFLIPNGAIYIFNKDALKRKNSYYTNKSYAYIMSKEKSIDIDDKHDFKIAEKLFLNINKT
tara:strand:- start:4166 stop:4855 length:690 start_codon:yes stop_codon:yes gene_type:complete